MNSDIWMWVVGITGLVLTILNVIDRVISFKKMANQPIKDQEVRIDNLETRVAEIERELIKHTEFFDNDKIRLDQFERQSKNVNNIVIKSLQALIEHDLNGNNKEQLHECSNEINNYLLNK